MTSNLESAADDIDRGRVVHSGKRDDASVLKARWQLWTSHPVRFACFGVAWLIIVAQLVERWLDGESVHLSSVLVTVAAGVLASLLVQVMFRLRTRRLPKQLVIGADRISLVFHGGLTREWRKADGDVVRLVADRPPHSLLIGDGLSGVTSGQLGWFDVEDVRRLCAAHGWTWKHADSQDFNAVPFDPPAPRATTTTPSPPARATVSASHTGTTLMLREGKANVPKTIGLAVIGAWALVLAVNALGKSGLASDIHIPNKCWGSPVWPYSCFSSSICG
ncbi:MAG TPA: hypothetical protein VE172_11090 [Stackebrandtia sp.]|uniref:hypothetical protein n=1 Tax=Stackebrandtia sp. TaxID=2023065 RepID=UPI002D41AF3D|nr:hypothetical protein [Stackebrandtia sp.]HZE39345.1 hypothetical protein [Stackebrandtia sp.]